MDYGKIFDEGVDAARYTLTAVCPYASYGSSARAWLAGYAFEQETAREHWQKAGRKAHAEGVPQYDCPHPHDPIAGTAWQDGWAAAEAEAKPKASAGKIIDATPTWGGILPALLHMIENGPETARETAAAELRRLARIVDDTNAAERLREHAADEIEHGSKKPNA